MLVWQPFEHFSFDIGDKTVTEFSGLHLGLGIHF